MDPRLLEGFGNFAQRQYVDDQLDSKLGKFGETFTEDLARKADRSQIPAPPLWQSLVESEDVSFPRLFLNRRVHSVASSTGFTNSGSNHNHSISSTQAPFYTPNINEIHLAFIRAAHDRIYDTVGLMVGKAPLPVRNLTISLYRMLPNGDLEHLFTQSNMNQWMTPGQADLRLPLPVALEAYRNEIFAVGIHQSGSGNTRPLAGIQMESFEVSHTVYPRGHSAVAFVSPGQNISRSQLGFHDVQWLPWCALGESGQILDFSTQAYADSFSRSNSKDLGINWTTFGPIEIHNQNVRREWESGNGTSGALWVQPLNYDDMEVECTIGSWVQGDALTQVPSWLVLRSNSEFTQGMAVQFVNASFRFGLARITGFNTTSSALATASSSTSLQTGQQIRFRVEGNRYRVYQNNVLRIDWTDPQPNFARGPENRFCGFYVSGVHPAFANYVPSTHIGAWAARDLATTS
ncbi:hypothetical protein [Hoyosella altamirensis]|uniref:Uncharacterized protein n=1 Tax=Hoyosella altamirensis TaxID=616997 RepID=A0A839RQC1_9ACTN|nr:hypothetical protein [Hoyosella altamirensis]MBB3038418.1 hypothetical protein [Hoyosella altamirensis]